MNYSIQAPHVLFGTIDLPRSKSISNRILIAKALCKEEIKITNLSDSDDTQVLLKAMLSLNNQSSATIDVGPAGTAYRFMTAYLAQKEGSYVLTGSERMKKRPIKPLVDVLQRQGAAIEYVGVENFPPLKIEGRTLKGGEVAISGNISSQYLSAILLIAPYLKGGIVLKIETELTSKPYVRMTLEIMKQLGVSSVWKDNKICIAEQVYQANSTFNVEADWSAASYWYAFLACYPEGEIMLNGLEKNSLQGDAKVAELFAYLGVKTSFEKEGVRIYKAGKAVSQLDYNFIEQPDLAQTLVVACVSLDITFHFKGLHTLKIKETNRIEALITELKKFGYLLEEPSEGALQWTGKKCEREAFPEVNTYDDHRMAMAFAPLAYWGDLSIKDIEVVSKSYPQFWNHLKQVGFHLTSFL